MKPLLFIPDVKITKKNRYLVKIFIKINTQS